MFSKRKSGRPPRADVKHKEDVCAPPKTHFYTDAAIAIATIGPRTWFTDTLRESLVSNDVMTIVTGYIGRMCSHEELSPYNLPCTYCEPERVLAIVTAPTLCSTDGCYNPVDTKALEWKDAYTTQAPPVICAYCHIYTTRKQVYGRFVLGVNGLGPKPAPNACAVLNCGKQFVYLSYAGYPVCERHNDCGTAGRKGFCGMDGQTQIAFECDHSQRMRHSDTLSQFWHGEIPDWRDEMIIANCNKMSGEKSDLLYMSDHEDEVHFQNNCPTCGGVCDHYYSDYD